VSETTTLLNQDRSSDQDLLRGIEMSEVGTWEQDLVTQGLTWSAVTRSLFGIASSDCVSQSLFLSLLDPQDRASTEAAAQRCIETGCGYDVEYRVIRQPSGSHWIRARGGIIADSDGKPVKFVGIVLDIDSQKRTEETLRTRETHLRSILDTVPDAMIVIDAVGIIQFFSSAAERMFGYTGSEAIGFNISGLMPDPDRARHDGYLSRYSATHERHIIGIGRIVTGRRRDGTSFPMHLSIGETQSGGKGFFTGFVRDLTEHQQTQAQLHDLQRELLHISRLSAMGEMASALAHELNQPLAAITNYMNGARRLLAMGIDDNGPKLETALDRAAEQAVRAGQIIRRLRDFVSRDESEKHVESLAKLIEESSALGLTGSREQGVVLRFDLDAGSDRVVADRVQIQQVLVNLFRNGLEAMSHSSIKELAVANRAAPGGMIEVMVADTGVGFAGGVPAKLFQTFFTTKLTGMGVGLSISRSIVEAHGGKMWAEANPLGGATFRFTLPAAPAEDMTHAA
jgi:two-component system sensor kinase FixL